MKKLLLLTLFLFSSVVAQTLPQGGVVYWKANPAAESVEWYTVEIFEKSQQVWLQLQNTSFCQTVSEFESTYNVENKIEDATTICSLGFTMANLGLPEVKLNDEICVRVFAAKRSDRSQPSAQACATVIGLETVTDPVSGLSQPSTPIVIFK